MKRKITEIKPNTDKWQMETIAHHQPNNAQPVPEQRPPRHLPLVLLLNTTSCDMEYPFGQLGSAVPLPRVLCPPALLVGWGVEKDLEAV